MNTTDATEVRTYSSDGIMVDEDFVRRAVDAAESNALRVALYQATSDPEVRDFRLVVETLDKGHLTRSTKLSIAEEDLPALREKAVAYLLEYVQHPQDFPERQPSDAQLRSLMQ